MRQSLTIIFIILLGMLEIQGAEPAWQHWARRFSGESDYIREEAIRRLKKMKDLELKMSEELKGPQPWLALEVVATLSMKKLIPEVMHFARNDETGMSIVTLNALIESDTEGNILQFYEKLLQEDSVPTAPKVVILDTFGRLQKRISEALLDDLFEENQSPELRSAVLKYLRSNHQSLEQKWMFQLVERTLRLDPFQLRVQALFLGAHLFSKQSPQRKALIGVCQKDKILEVRKVCKMMALKESL